MNDMSIDEAHTEESGIEAYGFACRAGAKVGGATGIITGLILFYGLIWSNGSFWKNGNGAVSLLLGSILSYAVFGVWLVMPGLCGAFVAKRTDRGAGVGASCGLLVGFIATVSATIIVFVCTFAMSSVPGVQIITQGWAPFVFILYEGLFLIAALGMSPLLGALGGGAYHLFANVRHSAKSAD